MTDNIEECGMMKARSKGWEKGYRDSSENKARITYLEVLKGKKWKVD